MGVKSPLRLLSETIKQTKKAASEYRTTLEQSEAVTRVVLIDPVLQALGWNITNIHMVGIEKYLDQTRVDYALYDQKRKVRIIVEAKQLGTNLDHSSITHSIINYAFAHQTKHIFITDGLVWKRKIVQDPENPDPGDSIDFKKDNVIDCAAYLVEHLDAARFWPEEETVDELVSRIAQLEQNWTALQKDIAELKEHQAGDRILSQTSAPASGGPIGGTSPILPRPGPIPTDPKFVDLATAGNATNTVPSLLRLPDGTVLQVHSWKNVLLECCKYAMSANPNIPIPLPDRSGRNVRLFSTVRPPKGITSGEAEYNSQKIYIYTNYDSNNCIANALHILNYVPTSQRSPGPAVVFKHK